MKLLTALRLGRVSNLPTAWSNVAAGLALSGAAPRADLGLALCGAISSLYVGGMYLNDAFDAEHDRAVRAERPIPQGEVARATVFALGFGLLALGVAVVAACAFAAPLGMGWPPLISALGLAAVIVFYDAYHKQNPLSPVVMAANRALVYVTAALALAGTLAQPVLFGAAALACYLVGLTYAAKQENLRALTGLWPLFLLLAPFAYLPALANPASSALYAALAASTAHSVRFLLVPSQRNIKRAVSQLIAGISLLDGMLAASQGFVGVGIACVGAWVATLSLQRVVPGT